MRIKLDENLPTQLARNLEALGHDVHTVYDEGLTDKADPEVWSAAQEDTRFLVTQDLDFSDARIAPLAFSCSVSDYPVGAIYPKK